jgi:hypothetical protein
MQGAAFLLLSFWVILSPISALDRFSALHDRRAGFWEATASDNGVQEYFSLQLETTRWTQTSGSAIGTIFGFLSMSESAGAGCSFRSPDMDPNSPHLKLACLAHLDGRLVPDRRSFDVSFSDDGKTATGIWQQQGRPVTLHLRRPPQKPAISPLVGNWIAEGSDQTCVLHVYVRDQPNRVEDLLDRKLKISIDVFTSTEGDYGKQLGGIDYRPHDGNTVSFSFQGVRSELFIVHLYEKEGTIVGEWPGHPDCGTFSRLPSESD